MKKTEKMEKHRFLVQCKNIESRDFDYIKSDITPIERNNQYSRIWESKENRSNLRLKVKFTNILSTNLNNENDKGITKLQNTPRQNNVNNKQQTPSNNENNFSSDNNENNSSGDNNENIIEELLTLQRKFDQVVEYTVHLTAERDSIVSQLEDCKRESSMKKSSGLVRGMHNEGDGYMNDVITNADKKKEHEVC
jgi:hypothetical protein